MPLMHIDLPGQSLDIFCPSKSDLERFLASNDRLIGAMEAINGGKEPTEEDGEKAVMDAFDASAELMSYNTAGVKITGKDLLEKFGVTGEALIAFITAYTDFIKTIVESKN